MMKRPTLNFRPPRTLLWIVLILSLLGIGADWAYDRYSSYRKPSTSKAPIATQIGTATVATAADAEPIWMPGEISSSTPPEAPDIFAVRTWQPPPPPPPPPAPPPPPTPPPLPYHFLARINDLETGSHVFILNRDNRVIFAKVGDTLDDTYKVESYANGQLSFIYLPMKARQPIYIGQDL